MNKRPRVLILTASYGNGHIQVAKSLEQACKSQGIYDVMISDLFAESNPRFSEITQYLYLKSFSFGKPIYRVFYYGTDRISHKKVSNWYQRLGRKRFYELVTLAEPDIIINTFPMTVAPEFRNKTGIQIPTFNVLTDFCLHKLWVHREIDKYYVATNTLKEKIMEFGVDKNAIRVTGIPIRKAFVDEIDVESIYHKYNLIRGRKLVLIMAGAHGVLKNVKEHCELITTNQDVHVVVVCGKNETLKQDLQTLQQQRDNMTVLGYVERVDELYRVADLMITKPGGITLSEAIAIGVPVVLYKPVPGQERENALFFEKIGAAKIVNRSDDLLPTVLDIVNCNETRLAMKHAMLSLFKGNAADSIIIDACEYWEKSHTSKMIVY
ncbi:diglucosyl diacylglycerol synthase [Bacillus sp. HMF5848]|uniref:diglucosyl diacylglycerol synthase n=1 Tax=Bacillus sp. HMF5848 TaxID=2495421 RepID=UPI000F772B9E|nr:diglucosyl diacylglycerol synthase [Bacillus sp. HMF5848]RSK27317.1 diglucosyl diacylglycerol synthase [Bacillus sp. HMF5848]